MTFEGFCEFLNVTPDERMKLARYLATLRAEATLKLGQPPVDAGVPEAPAMPADVAKQFAFFRQLATDPAYYKTRMGKLLDWLTDKLDPPVTDGVMAAPAADQVQQLERLASALRSAAFAEGISCEMALRNFGSDEAHAADRAKAVSADAAHGALLAAIRAALGVTGTFNTEEKKHG